MSGFSGSARLTRLTLRTTVARRAGGANDAGEAWFGFEGDVETIEARLSGSARQTIDSRFAVNARRARGAGRALQFDARTAGRAGIILV